MDLQRTTTVVSAAQLKEQMSAPAGLGRNIEKEGEEAMALWRGDWHGRKAAGWKNCKIAGYALTGIRELCQLGEVPLPANKVRLVMGDGPPDSQVYVYLQCDKCPFCVSLRIPEMIARTNLGTGELLCF